MRNLTRINRKLKESLQWCALPFIFCTFAGKCSIIRNRLSIRRNTTLFLTTAATGLDQQMTDQYTQADANQDDSSDKPGPLAQNAADFAAEVKTQI